MSKVKSMRNVFLANVVAKECGVGISKEVLDYAKGVSQLRGDTGVESFSFDESETMLNFTNGQDFFLVWDEDKEEYLVERECRQLMELEAFIKNNSL